MATQTITATMELVDDAWRITVFGNGVEREHYTYASKAEASRHLHDAFAAVKKLKAEGVVSRIATHRSRRPKVS